MVGRRLKRAELKGYDHIDSDLLSSVKVLKVPFLSPGTSGMALGHHIFLVDDADQSGRSALLAHELVHVRQFEEQGRTRFLVAYMRHYFAGLTRLRNHREAYLAIPAEVQARDETKAWAAALGEEAR